MKKLLWILTACLIAPRAFAENNCVDAAKPDGHVIEFKPYLDSKLGSKKEKLASKSENTQVAEMLSDMTASFLNYQMISEMEFLGSGTWIESRTQAEIWEFVFQIKKLTNSILHQIHNSQEISEGVRASLQSNFARYQEALKTSSLWQIVERKTWTLEPKAGQIVPSPLPDVYGHDLNNWTLEARNTKPSENPQAVLGNVVNQAIRLIEFLGIEKIKNPDVERFLILSKSLDEAVQRNKIEDVNLESELLRFKVLIQTFANGGRPKLQLVPQK